MLHPLLLLHAISCWVATLAFVVYGLIAIGLENGWTWRNVARIAVIAIAAPITVPLILAYLIALSAFSYKRKK